MNTVVHGLAARLANDGAGVLSIKVLGGWEEECYYYSVVRLVSQGFIHEKEPCDGWRSDLANPLKDQEIWAVFACPSADDGSPADTLCGVIREKEQSKGKKKKRAVLQAQRPARQLPDGFEARTGGVVMFDTPAGLVRGQLLWFALYLPTTSHQPAASRS